MSPQGGAIFGPSGIIWSNCLEVHKFMLHTKYQGFMVSDKIFFLQFFPYIRLS